MWCTRWFIPLALLPLPTAPPYFLAVFLLSVFLHSRPCFYCMMLLTALFTSSCYWQAVPLDAPLTRPLGNATTFGEALRANLSTPNVELPPVVQLLDRCWCNVFSRSGMFAPTDVSAWELASIEQARRALERHHEREEGRENEAVDTISEFMADAANRRKDEKDVRDDGNAGVDSTVLSPFSLRGLREMFFPTMTPSTAPKYRLKPGSPHTAPSKASSVLSSAESRPPSSSASTEALSSDTGLTHDESVSQESDSLPPKTVLAKLFRPYYDFRPYGIDITLDFRWNRQ